MESGARTELMLCLMTARDHLRFDDLTICGSIFGHIPSGGKEVFDISSTRWATRPRSLAFGRGATPVKHSSNCRLLFLIL